MMGTVFLQGLHPAQPPCVLGHRITGGQHRRTAARRFAVLVCGRCEQCEPAVVLRAGLWRPLASPFVCQTTLLASARHPDWPDHVGNVCHVDTALGRCQERLTRMTSPFPPTAVIPGQPGQGGEGARFSWAAMLSRVAGAKNGAMWARLCQSFCLTF